MGPEVSRVEVDEPSMLALWTAWALACTGNMTGRLVGFDDDGDLALIRIERDVDGPGQAIDLLVKDLRSGAEERMVILTYDDANDAAVRAERWKEAEARIAELGITIDADLTPAVTAPGLSDAFVVPGTDVVIALGQQPAPDNEELWARVALVHHGQTVTATHDLGRWHRQSNSNAITYPEAFWHTPKTGTVILQTTQGCRDPDFVVLRVPTEPATTPAPTVWCRQLLTSDTKALSCRDEGVTTLPEMPLPSLESIDLSRSGITDLSALARFPTLVAVDLKGRPIDDLGPLTALTGLKRLDLEGTKARDLSPLAELPLTNLDLRGTHVVDLRPLATRTDLDVLDLNGTGAVDLLPLSDLDLTTLDVGGTQVTSLAPIASMGKLRALKLAGAPVDDLSVLMTLPELHSVTIDESRHGTVRAIRSDLRLFD